MPEPLPAATVERVLVVVAHPDDADFGAAGTIATWGRAGIEVTYLLCTYGDQGGFDGTPRVQVPAIREAEQRAAAAAVGVSDVRFLTGYHDGSLEPTRELQRDIVRVMRQVRPRRVLMQSPERWWDRIGASHPDHLAAGEATIRALYPAARNPFAFPELLGQEGLEPWTVEEAWLMADERANHAVDITDTFEAKLAALRAHTSQTAHLGDVLEDRLRSWGTGIAENAGMRPARLAETFRVIATG